MDQTASLSTMSIYQLLTYSYVVTLVLITAKTAHTPDNIQSNELWLIYSVKCKQPPKESSIKMLVI